MASESSIKKILHTLVITAIGLITSSCEDNLHLEHGIIGDGETMISASISCNPLIASALNTSGRSDGDAIKDLENIHVFIYRVTESSSAGGTSESAELYRICKGDDLINLETIDKDTPIDENTGDGPNTTTPSDAPHTQAEATTAKATFTLKDIPMGRYRMYVAANIDFPTDAKERFQDESTLKQYKVEWENSIASNDAAFGYLAESNEEWDDFKIPTITLNKPSINLYAWLRRAASKVTVAFDGSGLHNGVFIYIKSVTIKDIPSSCKIGEDNVVTQESDLIKKGETIYYNQKGPITDDNTTVSDDYNNWLQISKGTEVTGTLFTKNEDGEITGHSEYAPALYFYENMQGNYEGQTKYNKTPIESETGTNIFEAGQPDYKDNIPLGTYIEVEAYYNSINAADVTNGRIIYRFMLGENTTYNYNAIRNHHYQITLGFKGFANQPDWHINYYERPEAVYLDKSYYISYMYNQKAIFPIRIKGDIQKFEVEIVENNWAPYDATQNSSLPVPPAEAGTDPTDFRWNKTVFENTGHQSVTNALDYSGTEYDELVSQKGYYYGLQRPYATDGESRLESGYSQKDIERGAPEYVTPIWAGFLALNVPGTRQEDLDAVLLPDDNYAQKRQNLKDYFYNYKQNYREFKESDLSFNGDSHTVNPGTNNACEITKAKDGSITIHFPMWTRPKSMLGISGFTGNNPFDTYQRRAIVKITATYKDKKITKFMPVYQVRRIVNPKAIWRKWDTVENDFHVILSRREDAHSNTPFTGFTSDGEWKAYVKTGDTDFITLQGGTGIGIGPKGERAITGETGSPIDFTIHFNGKLNNADEAKCAVVEVEYHGLTCYHSIFVRQGYNNPLDIVGDGVRWGSYALYSCDASTPFGTEWNSTGGSDGKGNYIDATLTASPLTLGSFFKRGNYNGIRIINNTSYGVTIAPNNAPFAMTNGQNLSWKEIEGYPFSNSYGGWQFVSFPNEEQYKKQREFAWGRFRIHFKNNSTEEIRYYRVPTYDEYNNLTRKCDYGIGIIYADGAKSTATSVNDAYGFEDFNNDGNDNNSSTSSGQTGSSRGMRGMIVYNPSNARQVFFPVGARGVGRRTITGYNNTSYSNFGILRYSQVTEPLYGAQNSFRPIPYNTYANPGALYWFEKPDGSNSTNPSLAWDVNYFDLNFISHSFPLSFTPNYPEEEPFNITHGGDAIPIKLVLDTSRPIERITP